jgi:AraC-like DNA-binding protein/mannose-6-phosphate isomerase-like protein (cupin superfamily)
MRNLPERLLEVYVATGARGQQAGLGLTGPLCLLEEVPIVGWTALSTAQRLNIPPHSHAGYEIIYLTEGSSQWWVGDSVYELTPGDVFVTWPGELHGLVNYVITPSAYYWIQLEIAGGLSLPGMSTQDVRSLVRDLDVMKYRRFAASSKIGECFHQILEEHKLRRRYSALLARSNLHALLIHLIRDHTTHSRRAVLSQAPRSSVVRKAMSLIEQRLNEPLSALQIPRNMSDSSFHQLFRSEVGWTPVEYRARCRVQRAKAMLRESRLTIIEVALELGFASGQYFATAFKKATGVTPSQYREQLEAERLDDGGHLSQRDIASEKRQRRG